MSESAEGRNRRNAGRMMSWVASVVVVGAAIAFLVLSMRVSAVGVTTPLPGIPWPLVFLPGVVGVANHFVTRRQREAESTVKAESPHRPNAREALAAALLLTGVFVIVANAASNSKLDGLVFAGYGAYVSTLWFMLVRLNANALSPRFLVNSALKASIAISIGHIASTTDLVPKLGTVTSLPTLYFLIGLFHSAALKALKHKALATLGVTHSAEPDLPVRLLEGVDDGAVDVLEEIGITSIQHLATMNAPEVCGRSLYPRDRVLDWIDQSILVMHSNGKIRELRAMGIRSAYALITIAHYSRGDCQSKYIRLRDDADARFKGIAQKLGLAAGELQLVAQCIETDPAYILLAKEYPFWRHQQYATAADQEKDDNPLPPTAPPAESPRLHVS